MKLFYHFLILVAASLIMVACASMFASTPEKKAGHITQTSGNNLNNDILFPPGSNTQLIFSDLGHYDFLNQYDHGKRIQAAEQDMGYKNLRVAADYLGFGVKDK